MSLRNHRLPFHYGIEKLIHCKKLIWLCIPGCSEHVCTNCVKNACCQDRNAITGRFCKTLDYLQWKYFFYVHCQLFWNSHLAKFRERLWLWLKRLPTVFCMKVRDVRCLTTTNTKALFSALLHEGHTTSYIDSEWMFFGTEQNSWGTESK